MPRVLKHHVNNAIKNVDEVRIYKIEKVTLKGNRKKDGRKDTNILNAHA
jgi:hypothetical protein